MPTTNFVSGTVVTSEWLNDIDEHVFEGREFGTGSVFNVKSSQYGAVGDGVADDTVAIQAAITAANVAGGEVFFPPGTYRITNTLTSTYTVSWRAVLFRGSGLASKIDWRGGNNKSMLHIRGTGGAGWNSHTRLEKLYFYANSYDTDPYSEVTCVQLGDTPQDVFSGVCNVAFNHCLFHRVGTAIKGYYESDQVWIENCFIKFFENYGIWNDFGGSGWTITNSHITDGAATSTAIRSSLSVTLIEGNVIQGVNIAVGIQIDGGTVKQGKCASIINNYFESQIGASYGVILYGVETGLIEGNTFNGFPGASLIALADVDSRSCVGIRIGPNRHTQSGGFLTSLVTATSGTTNCSIEGKQYTDGAVTTISGPFAFKHFDGVAEVGSGIKFPAAQVSSSDVNTLDDYEEGTWTPGLRLGATAQTVVSGATYTKVGNRVHVSGYVAMGAAKSGTGAVTITGLPFTSASIANGGSAAVAISVANVAYTGTPSAVVGASSNVINLFSTTEAGTRNSLSDPGIASNSEIYFSVSYPVA